jgi:hypothetical protein
MNSNNERSIKKELVNMMNYLSESNWREYSIILYILLNLAMPFATLNFLNIHLWHIQFNPVDFILKPFMIIPIASLLLALFTEWTIYAFNYMKKISFIVRKRDGRLSLKLVEKSLPIYIMDQNYFDEEVQLKSTTIVDIRIKDCKHLPFHNHADVIKLYNHQLTIPELIEKANLLVKNTALKNKPIIFIVDSQKERSRTISKIWLRLICNPGSKSAKADIHTILQLVD